MSLLAIALSLGAAAPIEVQGHRGARAVRPENTLAAFDAALAAGVDTLELDLGVSSDRRLVVSHEPYLDPARCLDAEGRRLPKKIPLASRTLAQIQTYDCGSLKNDRFPGQILAPAKMPSLEEVFDHVLASKHPAAKTVNFNIETKLYPAHPELTPSPEDFAGLVVAAITKRKMTARAIVQSFDHRTLVAVKKRAPKLRIAMLQPDGLPPLVPIARALGAEIVSPHHEWIRAQDVAELHAIGVRVIPWTANDEASWARLVKLGVDGIITDDPAALIAYLKKRKLR